MTTSRSVSPSNGGSQWMASVDGRSSTPPLPDAASQSTSAPIPSGSVTRAAADRSAESRLRSAPPETALNLLDLPVELLLEKIYSMDINSVVRLSRTNRKFYQLTKPIRDDYDDAYDAQKRLGNLATLSSDPHEGSDTAGGNSSATPISSPRFDEFNSLLNVVSQMRHGAPKAMVLVPLAESIGQLSPGDQRVQAFNDILISGGKQSAALHASVLSTLTHTVGDLPEDEPRLDAVNRLLTSIHTLPRDHRVSVLVMLAGKLNVFDEDEPIIDIANRIIVEAAELNAADNQMVLKQLVEIVRALPSDESRVEIYRATLVAAEKLPAESRQPILLFLANGLEELPQGHARSLAVNQVINATDKIPLEHRSEVLKSFAMNMRLVADGAPRTLALRKILHSTTKIPELEKHIVLKELASKLHLFIEGQPRIDALDSILQATREVPEDQKDGALLPLALTAHTLPELSSVDAFKRIFAEVATIDSSLSSLFLGKFLAEIKLYERTPHQMAGELKEVIKLTATFDILSRATALLSLSDHSDYRNLQGEHAFDTFSRILAMTTGKMPGAIHAAVLRNMGDWLTNLPKGQRIDAVIKLVEKVESQISDNNKATVLNKITDPKFFVQLLSKKHAEEAFRAMLKAVVNMPRDTKANALSNLANSIKFLPDAEIGSAYIDVVALIAEIPTPDACEVLHQLAKNIKFIAESQSRTHVFNGILHASMQIPVKFKGAVLQALAESLRCLDDVDERKNALDEIIQSNSQILDRDRYCVLNELAVNLSMFDEGPPRIDAFNCILKATSRVPPDQKARVLLPLAFGAHTLPEKASIAAFKGVMTEAKTMYVLSIITMLGEFFTAENRMALTPAQTIGEFNALLELAEEIAPSYRARVLNALTAHRGYHSMSGEHLIEAFNRVLAAMTNVVSESEQASVVGNIGAWIANMPEDQIIDAANKLVAQFGGRTLALNKLTDPDLFIRVLPKERVEGIFTAMLNAAVNRPPNEKERALSNLAHSIKFLPDDKKMPAFKGVAEAAVDMPFNKMTADVLSDLKRQIQYIPNAFKNDAHDAIMTQAATLSLHYKNKFINSWAGL